MKKIASQIAIIIIIFAVFNLGHMKGAVDHAKKSIVEIKERNRVICNLTAASEYCQADVYVTYGPKFIDEKYHIRITVD